MKIRFQLHYAMYFVATFAALLLLNFWIDNALLLRNFNGVLLVVLVYCFLFSWIKLHQMIVIIGLGLFFSFIELIKIDQKIIPNILQENQTLKMVFGGNFDMNALVAYWVGCAILYLLQQSNSSKRPRKIDFPGFS